MGEEQRLLPAINDSVVAKPPWGYPPIRHVVNGLCNAAALVCYIMRVNLAIAIVTMAEELHWNMQFQGIVMCAFFAGYISTQILGGYLAPKVGGKLILGFSVFIPAVVTMATPFVITNTPLLLFFRFLTGVGEGIMYPSFFEIAAKWWPVSERPIAWSVVSIGSSLGTIAAYVSGPLEIRIFGWQGAFYVSGALGLLWTVLWALFAADSPRRSMITTVAERMYIEANIDAAPDVAARIRSPAVFKKLLTSSSVWAINIVAVLSGWGFYVLLFFLPEYLEEFLTFSRSTSAYLAVLYPVSYSITTPIGGLMLKLLARRGYDETRAAKISVILGLSLPSLAILIVLFVPLHRVFAAVTLSFGAGVMGLSATALMMYSAQLAPNHSPILYGIVNTANNIPGFLGLYTTGNILQLTGSWNIVFLIPVACNFMAMMAFCAWGNTKRLI